MVQQIATAELSEAAAVLARAFRDNPVYLGLLKGDDEDKRERALRTISLGFLRTTQRDGLVEVIKEGTSVVAASLLFPPRRYPPSPIGQLITAWGVLRARLGRAHRFVLIDGEMQRKHLHDPHWFLWVLGVEPERQGQGLGSRLLRSLSAKADAEQVPCYLETDRPSSVRIYQNHGFEVTSEAVLRGADTNMWFMQRPPAASAEP